MAAKPIPTTPINERELAILQFVRARIAEGMPPTRREIAAEFGFKHASVAQYFLCRLRNKGLLDMRKHKSRGLAPVKPVEAIKEPT